jgi:hypothetical protein
MKPAGDRLPVLTSGALAAGTVIAILPAGLVSAADSAPRI